jgi:hypothetical protein
VGGVEQQLAEQTHAHAHAAYTAAEGHRLEIKAASEEHPRRAGQQEVREGGGGVTLWGGLQEKAPPSGESPVAQAFKAMEGGGKRAGECQEIFEFVDKDGNG